MKKQKLLFFSLILSMGISFISCNLNDDNGNRDVFQSSPAVIDWRADMGGTVISTPWGRIAAPSLFDAYEGDCIFLYEFVLDYDNQPTDKYYTATGIYKENVDWSYIETHNTVELGSYTLPFSNISSISDEFFMGRLFFVMAYKDKSPSFRLIYNSSEEEVGGVKNLYLQARPSSTDNSSEVTSIYAFNMFQFIWDNGRDTTKTFKGSMEKYDFRYIKANLNYVSDIKDDQPEYKMLNDQPIELYIFKDDY